MEYIRILGVNFESNIRSISISQDTEIKIAIAAAVVFLFGMIFLRRGK